MMGFNDVGVITAFVAGIISFLSPCVLPVAAGYITYITGTMVEDELQDKRLFALKRTLGFILGFTAVFMVLGLSAGTIGRLVVVHGRLLSRVSGALIVFMGLGILGIVKIRLPFTRKKRFGEVNSTFGAVAMGTAFAIGWTPCVGPVLGTILFYAGSEATATRGVYLLLMYSIGLSIPFLITAVLIDRISEFWVRISRYTHIVMKVSGLIVVLLGLMIFFDKLYLISNFSF